MTQESLEAMTIQKLREICKRFNIRHGKKDFKISNYIGKKKSIYIDNILRRIQSVHHQESEILKVEKYISETSFKNSPPLHNLYRKWFNLVDLADRYWYKVHEKHSNLF